MIKTEDQKGGDKKDGRKTKGDKKNKCVMIKKNKYKYGDKRDE